MTNLSLAVANKVLRDSQATFAEYYARILAAPMKQAIKTTKLITPDQELENAVVLINGERIEAVGKQGEIELPPDCETRDVGQHIVGPGLVDIHNHGANGHFCREGEKALQEGADWLVKTGTTCLLATIGDAEGVKGAVPLIKRGSKSCYIPGIRCEGPFLYPKYLPGDSPAPPPPADEPTFREMFEAGEGLIRIMDCSPDLPGGLEMFKTITKHGIRAAFAHGEADYELFRKTVEAGASLVTHTYNVMTGLHHRQPGAVGGALTSDEVICELNGDGVHVHPAAMDILIRCKRPDNVCLVSDMQAIAGLPDGEYDWSGRIIDGEYEWVSVKLVKKDGVVRRADLEEGQEGSISSAVYPIKTGIRNLVEKVGVPLKDGFRYGSLNAAKAAGLADELGSLEPGKRADLVVVDEQLNLFMTMVGGKFVYETDIVNEMSY